MSRPHSAPSSPFILLIWTGQKVRSDAGKATRRDLHRTGAAGRCLTCRDGGSEPIFVPLGAALVRTCHEYAFLDRRLATGLLMPAARAKADYEVMTRNDIFFAEHDGVKLFGDFYAPKGLDKAPVLVAVHGGGWQVGNRKFYSNLGPYLAKNGYAVFAIEYRLMKPDVKTYPGAVYDTKAAVQYVRAKAGELGIDPERIGMVGDSAGAHLSALVALAGEEPAFSSEYRSDPHASVS